MAEWHTLATIRSAWADARGLPDAELQALLDATREWCWRFVPRATRAREIPSSWLLEHSLEDAPDEIPGRYRIAQRLAVIMLAQLGTGSSQGDAGLEGYSGRLYAYGYDVQRVLVPPLAGNDPAVMIG